MKTTTKIIVFPLFILFAISLTAQVGIGVDPPDADAMLEIQSTDKGLLIPRMADHTTIAVDAASDYGMLVYDTTTNSFWYWDGAAWNELGAGGSGNAWELTGNAGTNPATNYVGTSDDIDLYIARNGVEMIYVLENQVSINDAVPLIGDRFTVLGDTNEWAVNGYASGTGGGVYGLGAIGVYGVGDWGVYGETNGATSFGVRALNEDTSGTGLLAAGNNVTPTYLTGGSGGAFSGTNIGAFGIADAADGSGIYGVASGTGGVGVWGTGSNTTDGTGVLGAGNNETPYLLTAGSGGAFTGSDTGALGIAVGSAGWGVYGVGLSDGSGPTDPGTGVVGVGNGETASYLTDGSGVAGTGLTIGVYGSATTTSNEDSWGGYFESNGIYAYVGGRVNTGGPNFDDYSLYGNGEIYTSFTPSPLSNPVMMSCPVTPEVLVQDYGVGELKNGYAKVYLDQILTNTIRVDENHPIKVFIQLEGNCNGVYVANKSAIGFEVKELNNGKSNVPFSWSIVATKANRTITLGDGSIRTSDNGLRFKQALGPMKSIRKDISKAKASKKEMKNAQTLELKELKKKYK